MWRRGGGGNQRGSIRPRVDASQVRRYLTYMKTTVSSKGQIVLPAEFRQLDRIEPGQEFEVERLGRGEYRLVRREAPKNEGVVDWLLACPHKGFFTPVDSESTDSL
jgi:AbrB family looped-hinge helix DNA binding protein